MFTTASGLSTGKLSLLESCGFFCSPQHGLWSLVFSPVQKETWNLLLDDSGAGGKDFQPQSEDLLRHRFSFMSLFILNILFPVVGLRVRSRTSPAPGKPAQLA